MGINLVLLFKKKIFNLGRSRGNIVLMPRYKALQVSLSKSCCTNCTMFMFCRSHGAVWPADAGLWHDQQVHSGETLRVLAVCLLFSTLPYSTYKNKIINNNTSRWFSSYIYMHFITSLLITELGLTFISVRVSVVQKLLVVTVLHECLELYIYIYIV